MEYGKILRSAAQYCSTESGARSMTEQLPSETFEQAVALLGETREAYLIEFEYVDHPVVSFDAVDAAFEALERGSVLEIPQLLRLARLLRSADKLQESIMKYDDDRIELLPRLASSITHAESLQQTLFRSILSEDELSDDASPALASARRNIRQQQSKIKDKLNGYLRSAAYAGVLQDRIVTIRDNRYVLPVKSEYKSAIPGLVHDVSDSGATCYIEPMPVVEANNKLKEAIAAEAEEIARVLADLSRRCSAESAVFTNNRYYCTLFDVIFARARFADSIRAVCPELTQEHGLEIESARHPLLDPATVVPTTVSLESDRICLLISGPNTGGKTVVLKTIGLFCLMAYSGFFLPCERASLAFYRDIFCDIGDNQSIAASLSTFSSHIGNIVRITHEADDGTLILLDELGAGTDPIEGAALAVSIVKYLVKRNIPCIVTTHYSELKEYGLLTQAVQNASMEFDSVTLKPTYRLKMGLPGVSNALNISSLLGLDREILEDAKAYIGEGKRTFEQVLQLADDARTAAEDERNALIAERKKLQSDLRELQDERDRVDAQYEKLKQRARDEVDKIVERSVGTAEDIIAEMNKLLKDVNAENLLRAKQLRTKLANMDAGVAKEEEYKPVVESELKIGDNVIVRSLNSAAKVKSLPDRQHKLDVAVGSMIMRVKAGDLAILNFVQETEAPRPRSTRHAASAAGSAASEINLLGQTVDQAEINVDAFIDRALVSGLTQVKVIHGVGTGALRKGLWAHFKRHPAIAEFRQGAYGEGGYGVTILTLK